MPCCRKKSDVESEKKELYNDKKFTWNLYIQHIRTNPYVKRLEKEHLNLKVSYVNLCTQFANLNACLKQILTAPQSCCKELIANLNDKFFGVDCAECPIMQNENAMMGDIKKKQKMFVKCVAQRVGSFQRATEVLVRNEKIKRIEEEAKAREKAKEKELAKAKELAKEKENEKGNDKDNEEGIFIDMTESDKPVDSYVEGPVSKKCRRKAGSESAFIKHKTIPTRSSISLQSELLITDSIRTLSNETLISGSSSIIQNSNDKIITPEGLKSLYMNKTKMPAESFNNFDEIASTTLNYNSQSCRRSDTQLINDTTTPTATSTSLEPSIIVARSTSFKELQAMYSCELDKCKEKNKKK